MIVEDIELDEEMDMPCPCSHCSKWFDLHDGEGSDKWYPGVVICKACHQEEEAEIEQDEEIDQLREDIEEAESTLIHARARLKELGVSEKAHEN